MSDQATRIWTDVAYFGSSVFYDLDLSYVQKKNKLFDEQLRIFGTRYQIFCQYCSCWLVQFYYLDLWLLNYSNRENFLELQNIISTPIGTLHMIFMC